MPNTTRAQGRSIQLRREEVFDIKKFEQNGIVMGGSPYTIKLGFEVDITNGKNVDLNTLESLISDSLKEAKLASREIDIGIMFQRRPSNRLITLSFEMHGEIDFRVNASLTSAVGDGLISLKAALNRRLGEAELKLHWRR